MAQLSIVRIDQVYGGQGIVTRYPVLDSQNGRGSTCIFEKQRIMPHTKTQEDVEISLFFIEQIGLKYGIAHGLIAAQLDSIFRWYLNDIF